jgi:hypothetical protein
LCSRSLVLTEQGDGLRIQGNAAPLMGLGVLGATVRGISRR